MWLFSGNITQCKMKMKDCVVLDKLHPEAITENFCTQHGISSLSADHCKDQLQMWASRHEGEICSVVRSNIQPRRKESDKQLQETLK